MSKYIKRIIDKEINESINAIGAISIVGPKGCGKTTTALKFAKSFHTIKEGEKWSGYPNEISEGENPRLLDEWDKNNYVWGSVKFWVDRKNERGLYILARSTRIDPRTLTHSGAGRILNFKMDTMSLFESNDSNGKVSLLDLFENKKIKECSNEKSLKEFSHLMFRGGWPSLVKNDSFDFSEYKKIYDSFVDQKYKGKKFKNNKTLFRVISWLAKNNLSCFKIEDMINELNLSKPTIKNYLNFFYEIYGISKLYRCWARNIDSDQVVSFDESKFYFCDPSIMLWSLGISEDELLKKKDLFARCFKNLVIRDLNVYSKLSEGDLYFYKETNGFEIDIIIEQWGETICAIEIVPFEFDDNNKNNIEIAVNKLIEFKNKIIDKSKLIFTAVITNTSKFYKTNEGVFIIPIQCLKD